MALVRGDKYTHAAFKAPTGLCLSALKVPRLSSWCVEAAWVGCVDADFFSDVTISTRTKTSFTTHHCVDDREIMGSAASSSSKAIQAGTCLPKKV